MAELSAGARPGFAWLFEMPPHSERTLRMEALIARLRLLVLCVNAAALALFLDTRGMHTDAAWWIICAVILYAVPVVGLQPYRRWRVFQASLLTTMADTLVVALFVAATGASASPFFLLYYLSVAAVAMRFELRQAIACCLLYAFTYAVVFFATCPRYVTGQVLRVDGAATA